MRFMLDSTEQEGQQVKVWYVDFWSIWMREYPGHDVIPGSQHRSPSRLLGEADNGVLGI